MEKDEKGKWKPGTSGNPNGRPKGTKNRFTKAMKEEMMKVIGKSFKHLQNDMDSMSPKDRVAAATAFLKFFISSKKEVKQKHTGEVKIQVNYKDDADKADDAPKMD